MIDWLAALIYRLFYRPKHRDLACYYTAMVMYGRPGETMSDAWLLASFFESFLDGGAEGTRQEFGPRDPVELKTVKDDGADRPG